MISTGRKQLIAMTVFFAVVAALGGLLVKRGEIARERQPIQATIDDLDAKVRAASTPEARLRLEHQRSMTEDKIVIADLDRRLSEIKTDSAKLETLQQQLKDAEEAKAALLPWWITGLSWFLAISVIVSFFTAIHFATEHGKRFLVTCAAALTAAGFFYFRGLSLGIDLRGGAELRYQLDTSAIDKEIVELQKLQANFRARPEETKKELLDRIHALEVERDKSTSNVTKVNLDQKIKQLESYLPREKSGAGQDGEEKDGLADRIKLLTNQRDQDRTRAVDVIRKRIDAAGIREISVQTGADGRLIAQVPLRNLLASDAQVADSLRAKLGAAEWDKLSPSDRKDRIETEKLRLRREQLAVDVTELQHNIETPGVLTFHDVDATRDYQRDAERWNRMLEWDDKVQALRAEKEASQDAARKAELQAEIEKLEVKSPAHGYMLREHEVIKADGTKYSEKLLLKEAPVTSGDNLTRAIVTASKDGVGREVLVYLNAIGGKEMEVYTGASNPEMKHKETRMAILLDGVVKSAPTVQSQLGSTFEITGRFTQKEADDLARVLNGGSLAFKPVRESESIVGPGLGQDSISAGMRASLVGSLLVVAFMAVYYLAGGIAANIALGLNILMILGAMSLLGGTMTLPGIAGIALTVGMAVDANVLIFERVREEKARGKPLKLALKAGQERALVTILDSNFTTMIIAFFLYLFGTGPVKGFAVTLFLGLITNLFTALYVTRSVMEYFMGRGWLTEFKMLHIVNAPKIPFMKAAPVMGVFSALLVGASIFLTVSTKDKLGLDFTGGYEAQVKLADTTDTAKVREVAVGIRKNMEDALTKAVAAARAKAASNGNVETADLPSASVGDLTVQAYEPDAAGRSSQFRLALQLNDAQRQMLEGAVPGGNPGEGGSAASRSITNEYFAPAFAVGGLKLDSKDPFPMTSNVGSRVASELTGKAVMAFCFSLVAMFIYIVLRFDFMIGFGLGAVLSLFHDAAVAVGALMVANRMGMAGAQIDLVIVAAVLTIIGFSINDTIVIFDRIRENRPAMRALSLREIVDISTNQTLSRTILTSGTVFIAVLCLLLLGGGTLRPFSLVFTAGVVVGTYSSVFIAAATGVAIENWRDRRREALKQKLRSAPAQTA